MAKMTEEMALVYALGWNAGFKEGRSNMTREEAKTFLLQFNTDKRLNPSEHEAVRVAISALEQEPCLSSQEKTRVSQEVSQESVTTTNNDEPIIINYPVIICDDAISRAELIRRLKDKIKTQRSTIEIANKLIPLINDMPSVQPTSQVLEDIKAEIEQMAEVPSRFGLPKVLKFEVLDIIDKHIGKEQT